MKVLELFAGTRSIGRAFEKKGHEVFSVEWNREFENIDLYADIAELKAETIINLFGYPDVIWASPDCTTYSIAAISHHRRRNPKTGNLDAFSPYAKFCDKCNHNVLKLIKDLKPKYYFIENPRGGYRNLNFKEKQMKGRKNKIYISGAITNNPEYKRQFTTKYRELEEAGFIPLSPLFINAALEYEEFMHIDFAMIDCCNAIYMMKGWENSAGAKRELTYAESRGLLVIYEDKKRRRS